MRGYIKCLNAGHWRGGLCIASEEATVFKDEEGWKFMLEGFMEPCGHTVAEAKASIREYSRMGFGLS